MLASGIYFFLLGCMITYVLFKPKNGRMLEHTDHLPNDKFVIISSDAISTVLEELGPNKRRFLVSTTVFGGVPIWPSQVVRKAKNDKEVFARGIYGLDFPPLIKDIY